MKPLGTKILLEIAEEKLGAIQTEAIRERGTILEIGPRVDAATFPLGATLFFKAWSVDIIDDGERKWYFISADSDAICGIEE